MKPIIYCKPTSQGIHSFYLVSDGREFLLFCQNYRKGVQNYFGKGVTIEQALAYAKSNGDTAVIKSMDKIPSYLRYLEKEYGIVVLKKTRNNKCFERNKKCA